MALKTLYSFTLTKSVRLSGVEIETLEEQVSAEAYVKVESTFGTKYSQMATVSIQSGPYAAQQSYSFEPDLEGPNFIKQAYAHLKGLAEFAGAEDC